MKPCLLTVDFDYFVREDPMWDWQHTEAHSGPLLDMMWVTRAANLMRSGVDLGSLLREEPSTFWKRLSSAGFRLDECQQLAVADSHAHGAPWAARFAARQGGPCDAFNFDAHHDLGYGTKLKLDAWAREGRAEAGSWARLALKMRLLSSYNVSYPEWRAEWPEAAPRTLDTPERRRVTYRSLLELQRDPKPRRVVGVLLVRSSAWTPPWLDESWRAFVRDGAALSRCTPWSVGDTETMVDRQWSESSARQLSRVMGGGL